MPGAHSAFSPSKWPRIARCPASWRDSQAFDDKAGYDAAYGSLAHWVGEQCLKKGRLPGHYLGETQTIDGFEVTVDEAIVDGVTEYVALINDLARTAGTHVRVMVEVLVDISPWTPIPKQKGTSDVVIVSDEKIICVDLKFGAGVVVYAENNEQGVAYTLGTLNMVGDTGNKNRDVEIHIFQPRRQHHDVWKLSTTELLALGGELRDRLRLAVLPDPPYNPSPKACMFCPAAVQCVARQEFLDGQAAMAFDDETGDQAPLDFLLPEDLVKVWLLRGMYAKRINEIEAYLMKLLTDGQEVQGLKLVETKRHSQWRDWGEAKLSLSIEGLEELEVVTVTPVSPAQAREALRKQLPRGKKQQANDLIEQLSERPPGQPALAESTDPRPALGDAVADAFDEV